MDNYSYIPTSEQNS